MSGLNCFLIVCFYARIVFPCLSFPLCISKPMPLAVCREEQWKEDQFWRDLCAGERLGFSSLSSTFVTFYFSDRALDLGPLCGHSST